MNRLQRRVARKRGQVIPTPSNANRSAEQRFAEAARLSNAARMAEAERLCRAALAANPSQPMSLLLRGIVALRSGRNDEAAELLVRAAGAGEQDADFHNNLGNALVNAGLLDTARAQFERASSLRPDSAEIFYNLGNVLVALRESAPALAAYRRALALAPQFAEAHINLGNLIAQTGDCREAIPHYQAAIAIRPEIAEAHNNLGMILSILGRHGEAIPCFERALAINANYALARSNLGNALLVLKRPAEAVDQYRAALALQPDYVNAMNNLANALCELERFDEARTLLEQARERAPNLAATHHGLGNVLQKLGRWGEAVASHERAVALRPDFAEAWINLAIGYSEQELYDKALACCDRAIAIEPARPRFNEARESHHNAAAIRPVVADLYCNIGSELVRQGRIDAAIGCFDRAIALEPGRPKFHFCHVLARRATEGDARLARLEALARDQAGMSLEARADLHFALAKAYGDIGRHGDSFSALLIANAFKRQSIPYDETITLANIERFARIWTREAVEAWSGMGRPASWPVLILGMPRSGSTLVEQILASHPAVAARGELSVFHGAAMAALGPLERFVPLDVPAANRAALLERLADNYLAALGPVPPGASGVTDKTPSNFAFIPLIRAALPNVRIIHTRRDPLDTCLSCFSTSFNNVPFSNDLGELGRYYRAYAALMAHWRAVMPEATILEVDYEALVADLETETRRILDHCGLPWNDACLSFHATERTVRTASAIQVRQPLYRSSVGRWRAIDPVLLKPLRDALGLPNPA